MCLFVPQIIRGDFLRVVLHMNNQIKSFQSGLITCRSTQVHGQPFTEVISTLTKDQSKASADKLLKIVPDSSVAGEFLQKTETSCKTIGYTAVAVRVNRQLMYSLFDRYRIPSIFFTVSPNEECSFRVRLWANSGQQFHLGLLKYTDSECIADFTLRKETRLQYPGTYALEYESIVQVILKVLFG